MKNFNIVVLPGDGIGPEVVAEGIKVLRAVERRLSGVSFALQEHSVGTGQYLKGGDPLPPSAFEACVRADAVLLGAMGLPDVRWPSGVEMTPQIDLRERLDLFCGLRPVRLFHDGDTPLRPSVAGTIDIMLVRENTEGLFSSRLDRHAADATVVDDRLRVTRAGSERLFHSAFAQARRRRRMVTLVDKANVLPSMAFFRRIFDDVAAHYPDVRAERVYVDAVALYLVRRPYSFDVLVTENMFGDILSDLLAGLVGGMGMAPSADIGAKAAVFQPSHGSAPDIAGRQLANPIATILSVAMMLDWLATTETVRGARLIESAVQGVLADPAQRTADMGGSLRCDQMGDLVCAHLPAE